MNVAGERIRTRATFIGTDGSMGFRNGSIYEITISISNGKIWIKRGWTACPYETMKALLKNWRF